MYLHQLTFNSFLDKHVAKRWIEEHVETVDSNECLAELKLTFCTNIALSIHQQKELIRVTQPTSYLVDEF